MSKLVETKQAYDRLVALLDREVLNRKGNTDELKRFREAVDVAFYLLGWGQFEYLTRKHVEAKIEAEARSKSVGGVAWRYLLDNMRALPVRKRLDIAFYGDQSVLSSLYKDYEVRNEAAHNYKRLPYEARDVSVWLETLQRLIERF